MVGTFGHEIIKCPISFASKK